MFVLLCFSPLEIFWRLSLGQSAALWPFEKVAMWVPASHWSSFPVQCLLNPRDRHKLLNRKHHMPRKKIKSEREKLYIGSWNWRFHKVKVKYYPKETPQATMVYSLTHNFSSVQYLFLWNQITTRVICRHLILKGKDTTILDRNLIIRQHPLTKHLVTVERNNSLSTRRNLKQNQAQEGPTIFHVWLGVSGRRRDKRHMWRKARN